MTSARFFNSDLVQILKHDCYFKFDYLFLSFCSSVLSFKLHCYWYFDSASNHIQEHQRGARPTSYLCSMHLNAALFHFYSSYNYLDVRNLFLFG